MVFESFNRNEVTVVNMEQKSLISREQPDETIKQNNICMYLCCMVALLASLSLGMMLAISSPLIPNIQQDKQNNTPYLDASEASWFGGVLAPGAIVGALIAGSIMQFIGRKITLLLAALPYIIGLMIISFAIHTWMLYVGRFITGLGVGMSALIVLIYIGEISPIKMRGFLLSSAQTCVSIGVLVTYGIGIVLPWRWLCAAATVPPLLLLLLSMFIVETPRYFMLKNDKEKVKTSLQRLRGASADIENEYTKLEENMRKEMTQASWWEIITERHLRTPTLLMVALIYFQQLSGCICVLFYAKPLFMMIRFTSKDQLALAVLSIPSTMIVFSLIASLIIEKVGRKLLLITSGVLMALSLTTFGLYFSLTGSQDYSASTTTTSALETLSTTNTSLSTSNHKVSSHLIWMAMISMIVFIASYSIGIGPVPKTYYGEIFPLRARGKAASINTVIAYTSIFVITFCFHYMLKTLTSQGTFWFFAANCVALVIFTIFCLPDTKGKTLEEIELDFQN